MKIILQYLIGGKWEMAEEFKYKTIADYSYDWETWEDQNGNLQYVSPSCKRISGYSAQDFLDDPVLFESIILGEDLEIWESHRHEINDLGKRYEKQFRILHKEGYTVWIEHTCRAVIDEDGVYLGYRANNRDITPYKHSIETITKNELQFQRIIDTLPFSLSIITFDGTVLYVNPKGLEYFEVEGNIIGEKADMMHWVHPERRLIWLEKIKNEGIVTDFEMHIKTSKGKELWAMGSGITIEYEGKRCVLSSQHDITERKQMEESLRRSEEKYRLLFENAVEAILVIQNAEIKMCNPMAETLTGYNQQELLKIKFTDFIYEEDKENVLDFHNKRLQGTSQGTKQQFRIVKKDGQIRWIESDGIKIDWNGEIASLQFAMDITDRKSTEEKILYLSYFDQLTGLYNRRFYEEELKRLDTKRNLPITLVMADVNGLKLTNDAFGHISGDSLLKAVADIMKKELRADDILARIGGDEFVLLLPKTDSTDAQIIVSRIKDVISNTRIDKICPSVSFGWDTKKEEYEDMEKIFSQAEDFMYRRKLLEGSSMKSEMIELITRSLHERDKDEQFHSQRVAELCRKIAVAMDLNSYEIGEIVLLGLFHDIGKIGINQNILNSNKVFDERDWKEIKKHPETGYHILKSVSEFSHIAEYVLCHHERVDGNGYPRNLKGDQIPVHSRILCIAEAYDSMIHKHYKEPISASDALNELILNSGKQFDEQIVKIFIEKVITAMKD